MSKEQQQMIDQLNEAVKLLIKSNEAHSILLEFLTRESTGYHHMPEIIREAFLEVRHINDQTTLKDCMPNVERRVTQRGTVQQPGLPGSGQIARWLNQRAEDASPFSDFS